MKNGQKAQQKAKSNLKKFFPVIIFFFSLTLIIFFNGTSHGAVLNPPRPPALSGNIPLPSLTLGVGQADSPRDVALTLQVLALMTILSLVPAILLMLTSFTRIIIVLGFVQRAIGLQQSPPQQVIAGLAMFLTMFTMYPTWQRVYNNALEPYLSGRINSQQAYDNSIAPVREFMFRYTRQEELSLIISMSETPRPANQNEVPTRVLIPAFMLSEMKTAFQMGVVIYIPFLVVDMVVSSVLLAMGMMMLPPMMISLPFKILLFVMADGWNLVVMSVLKSFTNVP
ncbi:MAG: flagellar type III secretion system pore protein FliP [Synergistaceae bacterium]|nr:flagellar type III secretion system pore protein FliP [Synergistaceae bacterium]